MNTSNNVGQNNFSNNINNNSSNNIGVNKTLVPNTINNVNNVNNVNTSNNVPTSVSNPYSTPLMGNSMSNNKNIVEEEKKVVLPDVKFIKPTTNINSSISQGGVVNKPNDINNTNVDTNKVNSPFARLESNSNTNVITSTSNTSSLNASITTNVNNTSENKPSAAEELGLKDKTEVKKEAKLRSFKYVVLNVFNKKESGYFDAESEADVRHYLESQDYKVLEIKLRSGADIDLSGPPKLKAETLSFTLTQLSTYLKAGIPLIDSTRIIAKQSIKPGEKKIWGQVVYELLRGESFSTALKKQGKAFPALLINMVKTAEMTGDLPSILDDMADYYTSMNQTRKQMISAMIYPSIVLTIAFGVLIFMLVYLVPQFTSMFEANDAKLPGITLAIMAISNFIKNSWYFILLGIGLFVGIFYYLFKNVSSFRTGVQTIMMKIPVIKDIIIYNEVANFTKTFASLINHGVFITDSMEILREITNNEIYKRIINNTLKNLAKGDTVSKAFRGEWAIPIVAYDMIVTGENTGQLGLMMEKVADHFQVMHKTVIDRMKSLMEPLMMIFIASIVGVILVSIVTPMFGMYTQIK